MKVALLTIIPTPYRDPLFQKLSDALGYDNVKIYYLAKTVSSAFKWDQDKSKSFQEVFLPKVTPNIIDKIPFLGYFNPSIISELNSFKPDKVVIMGYTLATMLFAVDWAKTHKIPYIMVGEMEISNIGKRKGLGKFIKNSMIKWVFSEAQKVLTIGTTGNLWCEHYNIPKEKVIVAPYSVDNDYYSKNSALSREEILEIKSKYNIPENNIVFVSVSRLIKVKQLDNEIIVFKQLEKKYNNISLVIIGNGEEEQNLKNLAIDSKNIIFTGGLQKPDIAKMYGISDCFVLNSNYEPWGLVVNEAMACSLPVIATTAVGAHYDVVVNLENGFVIDYDKNNINELSDAMEKIITMSAEERATMGKRSLEIISKWSYEETLQGYLRAINEVSTAKQFK